MDFKVKFETDLSKLPIVSNSSMIKDNETYLQIVSEVLEAKNAPKKTSKDYRRLNRYDVIYANHEPKLVAARTDSDSVDLVIKYFVHNGEVFDILKALHEECGHGGIHKMEKAVQLKYANIARPIISLFLNHCETCLRKRSHPNKGVVVQPLLFKEINARAQVDLIDFQSSKDGDFKFVLNYQEHLSKFVCLRALKTKTAAEVAYHLIDIFCTFGAPSVLQSDNGREFVNSIINELKLMWPALKIVHGKPRHSQSQGSVERANRDVGNMIRAWMSDNKTTKWHDGLRFVQFQKNNSHHRGINQSPFEVMFGRKAALGVGTALPMAVANSLQTEEEIVTALTTSPSNPIATSSCHVQHACDEINIPSVSNEIATSSCHVQRACDEMNIPSVSNEIATSSCNHELVDENENTVSDSEESNEMRRKLRSCIDGNRKRAIQGLEKQAKKMKAGSEAKFGVIERGTTVTVPVPEVDRSKCNPRNIIGVVLEVVDGQFYRIGTKDGTLPQLFSRGQIAPSTKEFLAIENVPPESITIREANGKSSISGGQGFQKCSCTTKCTSNKCACRKKGVLCNSRCHSSLSCCNK
ncbi:KRAB-A domain-containing protein 2-like [Planococcus citri]|uniref:KRAB-A domain-containing protein 2-like n=1 Tax=Planococcus citri TaxID=170843 RepID=UPI0031F83E73